MASLKLGVLAAVVAWMVPGPASGPEVPASNRAMEARLRAIYAATDPRGDPTKQAQRVRYFEGLVRSGKLSPEQGRMVYPQLANELLRAGDPTGALAALGTWETLPGLTVPELHDVHSIRALAFLRLGEQENCLQMHGQRACVFPLRAAAAHTKPRGAQGAVAELTWLLQHDQPLAYLSGKAEWTLVDSGRTRFDEDLERVQQDASGVGDA